MDVLNPESQSPARALKSVSASLGGMATRAHFTAFVLSVLALLFAYSSQIVAWVRFGLKSDKFSYILLIPVICAYFLWMGKPWKNLQVKRAPFLAAIFGLVGALLLVGFFRARGMPNHLPNDTLFYAVTSFVFFLGSLIAWFFGYRVMSAQMFSLTFLFLATPLPELAVDVVETYLQAGSAEVTALLFWLLQVPYLRDGTFFQLPGLAIRVAQECSGIHSTLVLVITSLLASRLLLRSTWTRLLILACILPLALVRNATRIVTISWLTIYYDPQVINGPLHHRGGPVFFVMSLIVLLALILVLRKLEKKSPAGAVV